MLIAILSFLVHILKTYVVSLPTSPVKRFQSLSTSHKVRQVLITK